MHKYLQAILWRFTCCTMRARIAYVILKVVSNGKWFSLELHNFLDVISVLHRECITYHYVLLISLKANLLNMKYIAIFISNMQPYDWTIWSGCAKDYNNNYPYRYQAKGYLLSSTNKYQNVLKEGNTKNGLSCKVSIIQYRKLFSRHLLLWCCCEC